MKRSLMLLIILATLMVVVVGCQTAAPPSQEPQAFFLEVTEPQDETVVNTSPIRISGSTSPGTTVSVNGELIEVSEQGNFAAMVEVEEGPNVIEVIATDHEGNEDYCILTVIYAP